LEGVLPARRLALGALLVYYGLPYSRTGSLSSLPGRRECRTHGAFHEAGAKSYEAVA
jgi:hypothetical protein